MKNINYDLIKLLHAVSDIIWRLEKHYVSDAEEAKCHSASALEQILENEKKHAEMLANEIQMRCEAKIFD